MAERLVGTPRAPRPLQIQKIREQSYSIYVSNLQKHFSKAELEAMVWRVGRITDVFIPIDVRSNNNEGFVFVKFATLKKAKKAIKLANGRTWGGSEIQANIMQFSSNKIVTKIQARPSDGWKATLQLPFQVEVLPEKEKARVAESKFHRLHSELQVG